MKNFIIFGVHRKIWVLGEGFTKKQSIEGELPKKWGDGVDTPMHTMLQSYLFSWLFIIINGQKVA